SSTAKSFGRMGSRRSNRLVQKPRSWSAARAPRRDKLVRDAHATSYLYLKAHGCVRADEQSLSRRSRHHAFPIALTPRAIAQAANDRSNARARFLSPTRARAVHAYDAWRLPPGRRASILRTLQD